MSGTNDKLGARSEKSESNRETWTFEPTPGDNSRGSDFRTVAGGFGCHKEACRSMTLKKQHAATTFSLPSIFNCQKAYGVNHMLVQYMLVKNKVYTMVHPLLLRNIIVKKT